MGQIFLKNRRILTYFTNSYKENSKNSHRLYQQWQRKFEEFSQILPTVTKIFKNNLLKFRKIWKELFTLAIFGKLFVTYEKFTCLWAWA